MSRRLGASKEHVRLLAPASPGACAVLRLVRGHQAHPAAATISYIYKELVASSISQWADRSGFTAAILKCCSQFSGMVRHLDSDQAPFQSPISEPKYSNRHAVPVNAGGSRLQLETCSKQATLLLFQRTLLADAVLILHTHHSGPKLVLKSVRRSK